MVESMPLVGKLKDGWIIPPANTGDAGSDYMSRCVVAIFGLTANTPIQAIHSGAAGRQGRAADRREEIHHDVQRTDGVRPTGAAGLLVGDHV